MSHVEAIYIRFHLINTGMMEWKSRNTTTGEPYDSRLPSKQLTETARIEIR